MPEDEPTAIPSQAALAVQIMTAKASTLVAWLSSASFPPDATAPFGGTKRKHLERKAHPDPRAKKKATQL